MASVGMSGARAYLRARGDDVPEADVEMVAPPRGEPLAAAVAIETITNVELETPGADLDSGGQCCGSYAAFILWRTCGSIALVVFVALAGFISGIGFTAGARFEARLPVLSHAPAPLLPPPFQPMLSPSPASFPLQSSLPAYGELPPAPPKQSRKPSVSLLPPPSSPHKELPPAAIATPAAPCDGAWVFIIATGRSGSTTVLDMLNLVPAIELSGEKGPGFCNLWPQMYESQRSVLLQQSKNHAFLNSATGLQLKAAENRMDAAVSRSMCTWIKGLEPRGRTQALVTTHGFKEIRPCYVNLLTRAFPRAKFILNFREDVEAQSHSAWFAQNSTHALDILEGKIETYRSQLRGYDTFELPLESFNVSTFNRLLRWLGTTDCTYRGVLHSNANKGYGVQQSTQWAIRCEPQPAASGDHGR